MFFFFFYYTPSKFLGNRAFSLVELLVVISVIAVIASLAIPNLQSITSQAHFAKNERNAQNIASLAGAARAAGVTNQWLTIDSVVDDLQNTIYATVGGETVQFLIGPLPPADRAGLVDYLEVNTTTGIVYYKGPTTN